jgi:hypothetical protein
MLLATFLFMLSSGLKASVEALFDRGDMDLLLSSPLPSRSIFTIKLGSIVAGVAALYLFFLAPFAHVGLVLGQFRWLALYPVLIAMAAVAASLAMLLTLASVRLLGARRTRVVAQVLGAAGGCAVVPVVASGQLHVARRRYGAGFRAGKDDERRRRDRPGQCLMVAGTRRARRTCRGRAGRAGRAACCMLHGRVDPPFLRTRAAAGSEQRQGTRSGRARSAIASTAACSRPSSSRNGG